KAPPAVARMASASAHRLDETCLVMVMSPLFLDPDRARAEPVRGAGGHGDRDARPALVGDESAAGSVEREREGPGVARGQSSAPGADDDRVVVLAVGGRQRDPPARAAAAPERHPDRPAVDTGMADHPEHAGGGAPAHVAMGAVGAARAGGWRRGRVAAGLAGAGGGGARRRGAGGAGAGGAG